MSAPHASQLQTMLQNPANAAVLTFLSGKSAHSDTADLFEREIRALGLEAEFHMATDQAFRPVMAYHRARIFGFAVGQINFGLRLPADLVPKALAAGARNEEGLDPAHWVTMWLSRMDRDAPPLVYWLQKAHAFAGTEEAKDRDVSSLLTLPKVSRRAVHQEVVEEQGAKPRHLLTAPENAEVLAFLSKMSAHTDVAVILERAVENMAEAKVYYKNEARHTPAIVHRNGIVFAFAYGQFGLGFRLPQNLVAQALQAGWQTVEGLDHTQWAVTSATSMRNATPPLDWWMTEAYRNAAISGGAT